MEHLSLYHSELPPVLRAFSETPAMRRLSGIGMNCGCEYTSFPRFSRCATYSRYEHSLGVGLIVWHFTHDQAQAVSGLLHDISTPVFAHSVDFLNGDYLTQESTEQDTRAVILASKELVSVLQQFGLTVDAVCDYHQYPIADNDTPRLSADRLEYTLGNALNYGFAEWDTVKMLYSDLTVGENEQGQPELVFRSQNTALLFAETALACSKVYVSDEDRFSMEALARLLKDALRRCVICRADLLTTEAAVIRKLTADPVSAEAWQRFCRFGRLRISDRPEQTGNWYQVNAKKRYIDPLVLSQGRVTELFPAFKADLTAFLSQPFDRWLSAVAASD